VNEFSLEQVGDRLKPAVRMVRKSGSVVGVSGKLIQHQERVEILELWGQFYKTFFYRNLRIFVISINGPDKPLQPSLMIAGKAKVYPIEAPFRRFTLG
jgi:hypothetical protein